MLQRSGLPQASFFTIRLHIEPKPWQRGPRTRTFRDDGRMAYRVKERYFVAHLRHGCAMAAPVRPLLDPRAY